MTNLFTQSFDSLLQQATGQVPVQQPNQQPMQQQVQAQPTQQPTQQPVQAQPNQQPAQQPVQTQPVNNTRGYVVDVFGGNDTPQTPPQTHYNGFPTSVAPEQTIVQPKPQAQPIVETKAEEPKVEEPKVEPKVEEPKVEPKAKEPKVEVKAEETKVKAEETKVETKKATKKATKKKATKPEPKVEEPAITVDHILDEETKKAVADQLYSTMYELAFGVIKTAITDAATAAINDLKGK